MLRPFEVDSKYFETFQVFFQILASIGLKIFLTYRLRRKSVGFLKLKAKYFWAESLAIEFWHFFSIGKISFLDPSELEILQVFQILLKSSCLNLVLKTFVQNIRVSSFEKRLGF